MAGAENDRITMTDQCSGCAALIHKFQEGGGGGRGGGVEEENNLSEGIERRLEESLETVSGE